ncbi:winged helix-turn-helix transcriptional regulator [Chondrinema litorale]|uniref:winged helix-turn-helix transcriptional regulator n=1 Tax=Chondrinema litorale TaxID=2994555 RepID=UPI0025433D99|nr:helix-turn-helix domain-containing protein [Chondrinema litorale]UZR97399.1 helix-turn-helix domain-containing protein [Chondrinema litorale]
MKENNFEKFGVIEECPIRNVLDRIGNKWSLLVLLTLEEGEVLRFNEIHGYIASISQKMLSVTLKSLEADGLVKRTVYPQIPPKVEYELTSRAQSLLPHLHNLADWANSNMSDIMVSRKQFELSKR